MVVINGNDTDPYFDVIFDDVSVADDSDLVVEGSLIGLLLLLILGELGKLGLVLLDLLVIFRLLRLKLRLERRDFLLLRSVRGSERLDVRLLPVVEPGAFGVEETKGVEPAVEFVTGRTP